jgi:transposase
MRVATSWSTASTGSSSGVAWRGVATRYEKRAVNYRAMVVLASIVLWLDS